MSYSHFSTDCDEHHSIVSDVTAEIVTLCGSMRFFDRMLTVAADLTSEGVIVLAPFCVIPSEQQGDAAKLALDALHKDKIRLATGRIVVVGESTRSEIAFAESQGLTVEYRQIGGPA